MKRVNKDGKAYNLTFKERNALFIVFCDFLAEEKEWDENYRKRYKRMVDKCQRNPVMLTEEEIHLLILTIDRFLRETQECIEEALEKKEWSQAKDWESDKEEVLDVRNKLIQLKRGN